MTAWLLTREAVQNLANLDGYHIALYSRRARKGPSGRPYWQRPPHEQLEVIPSHDFNREYLEMFLSRFKNSTGEKSAYHLRRVCPRDVVIERGEKLAPELAEELMSCQLSARVPRVHFSLREQAWGRP